ncbi:LOW QUALITY PROTEIN: odorant receptor 45a [Drosophila subobscura]|uniref:LOW QUALITY PROTEIN: odorant receptor 45a n=1 Tax=Drosophila subobscura TaxID=7241 RepID=UPI00155A412F|nr:LOW QUALITY PROTEIN: odorant receptor 45a [Drosophila subobscura]
MDSSYFAIQRRALEIVGFDPSTARLSMRHPLWAALLILSLVSHNWPMVVYGLQDLGDLTSLTDNLAVFMQGSLSTLKFVAFIVKRRRIGALVHRLHGLNRQASGQPQRRERILQENRLDMYVSKAFRNAAYGVIVASAVAPMLNGLMAYWLEGRFRPTTPMEFNFWLDERQARFYWPIYAWGVLGVAAAAWLAIVADTLFSWLVHNVVAQFQLLELELQREEQQQEDVHLVSCIRRHRLALELAAELSSIFAEIVFVQYMLSYLQLCMLAFRFTRSGWSPQVPFRAAFLLTVFMQLSSYCYGGEYLKQQSCHVAVAVYSQCDWSRMPPGRRRLWQLLLMRAQKPAKVFGYMFDVDLPLLLWVTKTTGSFLALLRTFER